MTKEGREKAKYIENREGIKVSTSHFISREGAKHHNMPTYWVSNGKGSHIQVIRYENEYYLTQPTASDYRYPIPYAESGRGPRKDIVGEKDNER